LLESRESSEREKGDIGKRDREREVETEGKITSEDDDDDFE